MMATIDELRQEPHWSYSALNTYLNVCQLQYFYRYVEQPEIERTSVCLPFGKAFHAALTAQAWECLMGSSLTREEIVNLFAESFKIETEATPNLIYKEGENFDSMIALATRMLDAALANWSDFYTIKGVAQAFKIDVLGLKKPLIGEWDFLVQDGRDILHRGLENLREPLARRESRPRLAGDRVQLCLREAERHGSALPVRRDHQSEESGLRNALHLPR